MTKRDFLFELGTEELPSGAVWPLADALATYVTQALQDAGIRHGQIQAFATPRRIALRIRALDSEQPAQKIVRRGPACAASLDAQGAPLPALLGFAKSCGVAWTELKQVLTEKGAWWSYECEKEGAATKNLLPEMMHNALKVLPIAKPMRWGDVDLPFVRPVHWVVMLWGEELIQAEFFGIKTGRYSYGHRFHHPESVAISNPNGYEDLLRQAFVLVDFNERRRWIAEKVHQCAEEQGYQAVVPESLLDEVTSIVEWPVVMLAAFDKPFLEVPAEALIASMQVHQKCFALQNEQGDLLPYFILVSNIQSTSAQSVILGNERVMRARLSDAAFFYKQDRRQKLSDYYPATAQVLFQKGLGSVQDKAQRLIALMEHLIHPLQLSEQDAERAAFLSKCDLMTGMVGEFPELQGVMGRYYAGIDGETKTVAKALQEQYYPRYSADELPKSDLGLALSLVDRLDTLAGAFLIGQRPTGDKDPYKLRRHALAIARLLMSIKAPLGLTALIQHAISVYGDAFGQNLDHKNMVAELSTFIHERLQAYYESQGILRPIVVSARACQGDWLFDLDQRIRALAHFVTLPQVHDLAQASKRVNHLLHQAQNFDKETKVDKKYVVEHAEQALLATVESLEEKLHSLFAERDYGAIFNALAALHGPVDVFFQEVMVMVDDLAVRCNRLALLQRLQHLLQGVADISQL